MDRRVNIGFAKLQMLGELRFSETLYGLGAGIFFLGYFFFEVPSNLLLERIGAKRTIARITIGWGLTCIAMMRVKTPGMFYFLRFLLGAFEAGFYPGVILYLTYWFPTGRRAKAFGLFMSASALAGVIGGPVVGNLMTSLHGANGWSGWQWVFLIEGVPSVIAGIVMLLYLTDRPKKAGHWLTAEQRRLIAEDLERDRAALGEREHSMFAALRNSRIWQFVAVFFCIIMANSALIFFGPTIVREVGFASPAALGWIMSAIYLCGAAGMILNGMHSDRQKEVRLHCGLPRQATRSTGQSRGWQIMQGRNGTLLLSITFKGCLKGERRAPEDPGFAVVGPCLEPGRLWPGAAHVAAGCATGHGPA